MPRLLIKVVVVEEELMLESLTSLRLPVVARSRFKSARVARLRPITPTAMPAPIPFSTGPSDQLILVLILFRSVPKVVVAGQLVVGPGVWPVAVLVPLNMVVALAAPLVRVAAGAAGARPGLMASEQS